MESVFEQIADWLPLADGVTISGGEPFDQPNALKHLLTMIRKVSADDVLVYSGFSLASLRATLSEFEGLIDALITEPFDVTAPQTLALRGSDNQKLVTLTSLGEDRFGPYNRRAGETDKNLDLMFHAESGQFWLAGIPKRGDLQRLTELLGKQGHLLKTSEHDFE